MEICNENLQTYHLEIFRVKGIYMLLHNFTAHAQLIICKQSSNLIGQQHFNSCIVNNNYSTSTADVNPKCISFIFSYRSDI